MVKRTLCRPGEKMGRRHIQHQFFVVRSNGARVVLRNHAPANTCNWNLVTPDTYQIGVNVRNAAWMIVDQEKTMTVIQPQDEPTEAVVF